MHTYSHVVQLSTIRMLLVMKIIISLKIKAVGFSNTFAQDELKDPPVYMYYPPTVNLGRDTVLSFNNSLPAITKTFHT